MRTLRRIALLTSLLAVFLPGFASAIFPDFSQPDAEITKVKYERVNLSARLETSDPMTSFEQRYLLFGAYKSADYYGREGKYYTIWWRSKDRSPGLVVRFEYVQANSEEEIKVKEVGIDKVKRTNLTKFEVIGEEFIEGGNVLAWRVSLVRNGETIATSESFLWD